jgi:hypothetical protein
MEDNPEDEQDNLEDNGAECNTYSSHPLIIVWDSDESAFDHVN